MIISHSHYQIGSTHKFCEDFALHGTGEDEGYAIVCDGCSSSGISNGIRHPINVDFGARILSVLTRQTLFEIGLDIFSKEYWEVRERVFNSLFPKIKSTLSTMNIPYDVLNATMLIGSIQNGTGSVLCVGDGVFAFQTEDDVWHVYMVEFTKNAPCYVSYFLDQERLRTYKKQFDGQEVIVRSFDTVDFINIENEKPKELYATEDQLFFRADSCKKVALFSDGINTFCTQEELKSGKSKNPIEIISKILSFSPSKGEFVTKRFNVLNSWCKKNQVTHYDDLSVAIVAKIQEESENGNA